MNPCGTCFDTNRNVMELFTAMSLQSLFTAMSPQSRQIEFPPHDLSVHDFAHFAISPLKSCALLALTLWSPACRQSLTLKRQGRRRIRRCRRLHNLYSTVVIFTELELIKTGP